MNNQQNNPPVGETKESLETKERRMLPFAVEFVKFFIAFAVIIAIALLCLHFASIAMQDVAF